MANDTQTVALSCDTIDLLLAARQDDEEGVAPVIDRLALSYCPPVVDGREPIVNHEIEPVFQRPSGKYHYQFLGDEGAADTLGALLVKILEQFADLDAGFLEKFSRLEGRSRRFLARNPKAIYPGREDLSHYTAEVRGGWWVGTNYGRVDVRRLLRAACQITGLIWQADLVVEI